MGFQTGPLKGFMWAGQIAAGHRSTFEEDYFGARISTTTTTTTVARGDFSRAGDSRVSYVLQAVNSDAPLCVCISGYLLRWQRREVWPPKDQALRSFTITTGATVYIFGTPSTVALTRKSKPFREIIIHRIVTYDFLREY